MVTKKAAKKSTKSTAAPKLTTSAIVQDVFSTEPKAEHTIEVPKGQIRVFINGRDKGSFAHEGKKLKEFVTFHAQQAGIRTFSVYVDDARATTAAAGASLEKFSKIEIVAKDSRG